MIICRNCGNEVEENEIFCNCCSHNLEESLADSQSYSNNNIQYLNNKKSRFAAILVASIVIGCFCAPILSNYKLNHDINTFEQSFSNKKYNTAIEIYHKDRNNKKFSQQIRNYISGKLNENKSNKKVIALEAESIIGNSAK